MCRMCLVDIDTGRGPALGVSCMVTVDRGHEGRHRERAGEEGAGGRARVPPDQPPARLPGVRQGRRVPAAGPDDEPRARREPDVEEKRHYEKPIPISDLVYLDRERCILCDRCTRFAKEVAGDPLIHFTHRGNETQILTFPDEPFASYFSGNTVQICPVGALTAKPYRFKARPWDLDQTESTCTTCSVGCRITVQSSRNQLLRYQGVDSDPVNWGWLCDKGRFDFEAVNSERAPARAAGRARAATARRRPSWSRGPRRVAAAGPAAGAGQGRSGHDRRPRRRPRHQRGRLRLGQAGQGRARHRPRRRPARRRARPGGRCSALPRATIDEACAAPTVVLLGPDLKEELPVLYLRLRDAAEKRRTRLVELATPRHRPHAVRVEEPAAPAGRAGRAGAGAPRPRRPAPDGTGVTDADVDRHPRAARPRARGRGRRAGVDWPSRRPSPRTPSPSLHGRPRPRPRSWPRLRRGNVQRRPRHGSRARAAAGRRRAGRRR